MTVDMVRYLWKYMVHADQQMLAAAVTVPPDAWDQEFGISSGSVRKLTEHCVGAQTRWLVRIGGPEFPIPESVPREQLAEIWGKVHGELLKFAEAQTDETINKMVRGHDRTGQAFELPLGACMLHVADHATYHRGQLNSMIKMAGGQPSPVMLYTFAKTHIE